MTWKNVKTVKSFLKDHKADVVCLKEFKLESMSLKAVRIVEVSQFLE